MKIEDVIELCNVLKLKTISQRLIEFSTTLLDWEERHEQYLCYLHNLLEFEYKHRQEVRTLRLIKEAKFPILKGLESFDFKQVPYLPEKKIHNLANGGYIKDANPIIFLGESGTGKTHLATAIGYQNAQLGYSVRFVSVSHLANELIEAYDTHQLNKLVDYYAKFAVLILDLC